MLSSPAELIDFSRPTARIRVSCPHCQCRCFYNLEDSHNRENVPETLSASCRSMQCGKSFLIRVWEPSGTKKTGRSFLGKEQVIPVLALPNCEECKGTGEYVGFLAVEPCSKCSLRT